MKKYLLLTILLASVVLLTGCVSDDQVEQLQAQVDDLQSTIEQCNNNIENAKSYEGSTYEDLEDAIENLENCSY